MNRAQLMQTLVYLAMACFVAGGGAALRYRQAFRGVAIVLYAAAVAIALVWVSLWLAGVDL